MKYDCKPTVFWLNLNSLTLISLMVICLSKNSKNSLEATKNNINSKQVSDQVSDLSNPSPIFMYFSSSGKSPFKGKKCCPVFKPETNT